MINSANDVLIVGGGPAGIAAAIAAGRSGARTTLVERHPILGGMGTAALVNNFCNAHWDGIRFIIGGIFAELRARLVARRALHQTLFIECYDPSVFIEEVGALIEGAGVEVRCGSGLKAISFPGEDGVVADLTDGTRITARTVVDASGDAIVAHAAGVPCTFGRAKDGRVMPLTWCYLLGGIDVGEFGREYPDLVHDDDLTGERRIYFDAAAKRINALIASDRSAGLLSIPRDHVATLMSVPRQPGVVTVNYGRVFISDPTDPAQLAAAEAEGLRQIDDGIAFFRRRISGFQRAELVQTALQIGVRESRQIVGRYTLTREDVVENRQFDDAIAQCCYPMDIHEPDSDRTTFISPRIGAHFDIPWRSLVPLEGPPNLVVAGRCISGTHEAMSSFRVSPSLMAVGEAAGIGAALAARHDGRIASVDPSRIRRILAERQAILT